MEEVKRDPREDISLIRQMLERTMGGMKAIVPWFTGFGILWLLYGGLSALQRLALLGVSLSVAQQLSRIGGAIGLLFCFALAAGFLACRSILGQLGLDLLTRKLVDVWGVCIFLFLALTMLLSPVISFLSIRLGYSAETAASLFRACALCRSFLFLLLPVVPLLITADFLDDGKMFFIGILLAVLAVAVLCAHALMLFGDGISIGQAWQYFWLGATCLLDLFPGIMLLGWGRQLKGR